MQSKFSLSAILTAAALTSAVVGTVIGTALPGQACIYSSMKGSTTTSITGDGSGSSNNALGFNSPQQSGIIAAGLAALGLFAGGMVLKAKLSRPAVGAVASEAAELAAAAPKPASVFPIEVPAEALAAADRAKESVR